MAHSAQHNAANHPSVDTMLFSIIVPVYNRPDEVRDLVESLSRQSDQGFELILVEDGSTVRCDDAANAAKKSVKLKYFYKSNEGRSIARNYGIERADGDYFVFVDSDCVLPDDYIEQLRAALRQEYVDCFGGPDAAHDSFTDIQKAINYSMTSFLTTGGIRGGKIQMEKFVPRTFNMGFSRRVWQTVGGFREMFSEDIDMSTRIRLAGFSIKLKRDVKVYHKRRVDLKKFWRQVYVFGMSRITLKILYPDSLKLVHTLPAVFTIGSALLIILSVFVSPWFIAPLAFYIAALWISGIAVTRSLKIGSIAVLTGLTQLYGYGTGFIKAYILKILLRRGRNVEEEIELRRGK